MARAKKAARRAAGLVLAAALGLGTCLPAPALAQVMRAPGDIVAGASGNDGAAGAVPATSPQVIDPQTMAADELLVVMDQDVLDAPRPQGLAAQAMQSAAVGLVESDSTEEVVRDSTALGTVLKAEVPEGRDAVEYAQLLAQMPGVERVQPNFRYKLVDGYADLRDAADLTAQAVAEAADAQARDLAAVPQSIAYDAADDPLLWRQYYLGDYEGEHGANVLAAWDQVQTNYSVTVAVLDTGCRVDHEDLAENVDTAHMWDAYTGTLVGSITSPEVPYGDNIGHGTHVCGLVAAQANNGRGVAGVSYNATVLPVKVFDNNYDPYCSSETSDILKAYDYLFTLVDYGKVDNLHVVNMSLGGYEEEETDDLFREAIAKARTDYDIVSVCAGGNGEDNKPITDPCYPSDFPESFSVTALNTDGTNVVWSDYNEHKDISAPGVSLLSTYYGSASDYESLSGTSMASPVVAGVFALLWAKDPALKAADAEAAVLSSALPVQDSVRDRTKPDSKGVVSGSAGAIDAARALAKVEEGVRRVPLTNADIQPIADQLWTGSGVEPRLEVSLDGVELTEGEDYRVAYSNNVRVGTASATVTGRGSYSGRKGASFSIFYDMSQVRVLGVAASYDYTGKAIAPVPRVSFNGRAMAAGKDYDVAYLNNVDPGTATVRLTGRGDYLGTKDADFEIATHDVSEATVTGLAASYAYTGQDVTPSFDVSMDGRLLAEGWDYYLDWNDNRDPGTATVSVVGMNEFSGQLDLTFAITRSIAAADVAVSRGSFTYSGGVQRPTVGAVTLDGARLVAGRDYTVAYSNASSKAVGSYSLTVAGKGAYTGQAVRSYRIAKAANPLRVKGSTKTLKRAKLKKKAQAVAAVSLTRKAAGKVSYAKAGGSARLSVNARTGKVTVKKGTGKGTYAVKVKVRAAGDANRLPAAQTVTCKVRVK